MANRIVIVGGGSAGWMTAAILVHSFPNKDITVIEDPDTPPIGVGESTYEGIKYYCEFIGVDEQSFFKETDASLKIGLTFSNFYKKSGYNPFIYSFGKPYLAGTRWGLEDWLIKKSAYPETPTEEFAESYFPQANLAKHGRFSENVDGTFGSFDPKLDTALHFDAIKFGGWLRDFYSLPKGVKLIKSKVSNVNLKHDLISSLSLENGMEITADLFIDCTGFKSMLLSQALQEPFLSYSDVLPNNSAWATRLPYKDPEKELAPVTKCTAIENGWCWDIPLWSRLGAGYVYSDKYVSKEEALEEFKQHLMSEEMIIPRSREEVDSLEYNSISMRVGIHKRTWVGNVVAIGLSAGFIEPLESNGLFTVHEFLYQLVRTLLRGDVSQWDRDVYNSATKLTYDGFAEFIRLHYALSLRDDTKYWKDNLKRSYDFSSYALSDEYASTLYQVKTNKTKRFETPSVGGDIWIATGLNYPTLDPVSVRLGEIRNKMNYKEDLSTDFFNLDQKRLTWSARALASPTLYQYLKEKYYE
jgi:flavin-dependent dehydrogenase